MKKTKIIEIFSSIQGEGLYVGEEHVFVRFYGCNLGCEFCDENEKTSFLEYGPYEVIEKVISQKKKTVSLTGGEPLLHVDFLKEILPALKQRGLMIYLETNGTLTDNLSQVLDLIDIISMDIKLPSSTGLRAYWHEHSIFLKKALGKDLFVKSIVTSRTKVSDLRMAVSIVGAVDKDIPFIIQQASYNGSIEEIDRLSSFFDSAKKGLNDVRIMPQVHKILGVR
ncbi:MAG: 7-carboxy-7-deazaguanine synthase QueE [Candidatus Omnitrophota bacterium]